MLHRIFAQPQRSRGPEEHDATPMVGQLAPLITDPSATAAVASAGSSTAPAPLVEVAGRPYPMLGFLAVLVLLLAPYLVPYVLLGRFASAPAGEGSMAGLVGGIDELWSRHGLLGKPASPKGWYNAFATDGFSFAFKVHVDLGSDAFAERRPLVSNVGTAAGSAVGAVGLWADPSSGDPTRGKVRFLVGLLNRHIGSEDIVANCSVSTESDLLANHSYDITVWKDTQGCCILALGGGKGSCSRRPAHLRPADFQVMPVANLELHRTPPVRVSSFKQFEGGLTLSFDVANVRLGSGTGPPAHRGCHGTGAGNGAGDSTGASSGPSPSPSPTPCAEEEAFADAIRGAIADLAGGHHADQKRVSVAYKLVRQEPHAASSPPALPSQVEHGRGHAHKKEPLHDEVAKASSDEVGAIEGQASRPASGEGDAVGAAKAEPQRRLGAQRLPAGGASRGEEGGVVAVQITLSSCGHCRHELDALTDYGVNATIARRVREAVGHHAEVHVLNFHLPAAPTSCADFECPAYRVNAGPEKVCYGGDCAETCCAPTVCARVACTAPMVPNVFLRKDTECESEEDCENKCCLVPCDKSTCSGNSCPKPHARMIKAPPEEAQDRCCEQVSQPCCSAPIAWCAACSKCQGVEEYCRSEAKRSWFPFRRLSAASAGLAHMAAGSNKTLAGLLAKLSANDLSGGLPPVVFEGVEADEEENETERPQWGWSQASNGKSEEQPAGLPEEAPALLEQAERFRRKHMQKAAPKEGNHADGWREAWKHTLAEAEEQHDGASIGCEGGGLQAPCPYKFSSIFLLHRGLKPQPSSANAVQVLADTLHAVSCGDDGRCWIWEIATGKPKQVFIHSGPVHSVSVITDGVHVLSAGAAGAAPAPSGHRSLAVDLGRAGGRGEGPGEKGEAHLWAVNSAAKMGSIKHAHGAFLSTAQLQSVYKSVVLGCSDGYVSLWDWRAGHHAELPYTSEEEEEEHDEHGGHEEEDEHGGHEEEDEGDGHGAAFFKHLRQRGGREQQKEKGRKHGRDAREAEDESRDGLLKHLLRRPSTGHRQKGDEDAPEDPDHHDDAGDGHHGHEDDHDHDEHEDDGGSHGGGDGLGPVRATAFLPGRRHFVAGYGMGELRCYDADSSQLLWATHGHEGAVTALVAPTMAWHGSGEFLSGGEDGVVRLWTDEGAGSPVLELEQAYGGPVRALAVVPGSAKVAVGSEDGYIRIWDLRSGELDCAINTGGGAVQGLAVNPSDPLGQILAAGRDGYVRVFSPP